LNRKKKRTPRTNRHLQIIDGAVMNITRGVIEELVGKNKAIGPAFELAVFGPVKHCTWTGFIWSNPRDNHTLSHMISLCYMDLQTQIKPKIRKQAQPSPPHPRKKKKKTDVFGQILGKESNFGFQLVHYLVLEWIKFLIIGWAFYFGELTIN
jgi:hypothetical protein